MGKLETVTVTGPAGTIKVNASDFARYKAQGYKLVDEDGEVIDDEGEGEIIDETEETGEEEEVDEEEETETESETDDTE